MVSSRSSNSPHYVRPLASGQYVCDGSCLQWKSSQICAHTVAVSESNGDAFIFGLVWYVTTNSNSITHWPYMAFQLAVDEREFLKGNRIKHNLVKKFFVQPLATETWMKPHLIV